MGFMDKVKETASKGTEMAKGAAKTGQDKLEEQKTKKKIGELKEELGGVVYAERTGAGNGSADAEIARLVGEIGEAEAALEAIGAEDESADGSDTPTAEGTTDGATESAPESETESAAEGASA
jgi:hypothetical protein